MARAKAGGGKRPRKPAARRRPAGKNAAALEVTLAELRRAGRLEAVDEARVQAVRSIAAALDVRPFNAQLWKEYREGLRGLMDDGDDDGTLDELLEHLRSPVRDTPPA